MKHYHYLTKRIEQLEQIANKRDIRIKLVFVFDDDKPQGDAHTLVFRVSGRWREHVRTHAHVNARARERTK